MRRLPLGPQRPVGPTRWVVYLYEVTTVHLPIKGHLVDWFFA